MKLQKLLKFILLALLISANNLYATNQIDVTPFYFSNYSENFSKKFKFLLDAEIYENGNMERAKILFVIENGHAVKQFDKNWIGVTNLIQIAVKDQNVSLKIIDLYDEKTKRIAFTVDMDDGEITKYEWIKQPKSMKPDESIVVGKSIKRSSEQKVISTSEISYKLVKRAQGYEFCSIDKEIEFESKNQNITYDCDLFDQQKRIIGNRIEAITNKQLTLKGMGRVEIEKN